MLITYQQAKAYSEALDASYDYATKNLKELSGPTGPMGLTPDSVKTSAEWKQAKSLADSIFRELRAFNTWYVLRFKKEIAQDRAQRLAQREKGSS